MKLILQAGLVATLAIAAWAGPKKVANDLDKAPPDSDVDVVVRFRGSTDQGKVGKVRNRGALHKRNLGLVRGASFRIKAKELKILANDPDVEYISKDRTVKGSLDYAERASATAAIRAMGLTGKGVGVAVIDSGLKPKHKDFSSAGDDDDDDDDDDDAKTRIVYAEDFTGGKTDDKYGHGTHVAGIIAGNGSSSSGKNYQVRVRGVAPGAHLLNLKVLDDEGVGQDSDVIAAIERAIQLKTRYNIRVINLSLGRPVFESFREDPLCMAVEKAWKAGIVVVVAAGNMGRDNSMKTEGYGTITSPGNSPYVITVGAMKSYDTESRLDDHIASYSSKGPTLVDQVVKPDLVAAGNKIVSMLESSSLLFKQYKESTKVVQALLEKGGKGDSNDYFSLSGTSMATPMVSGTVALMLEKDRSLTPDQVKARLMKTAWKSFPSVSVAKDPDTGVTYTSIYDLFTVGAGYLDATAAINSNEITKGSAASPRVVFNSTTQQASLRFDTVTGENVLWGSNVIWGTNVVWGSNVIWGTNVVWGSNVIWGTSSSTGFNVLWGVQSPWSTNVIWGTSVQAMGILIRGE